MIDTGYSGRGLDSIARSVSPGCRGCDGGCGKCGKSLDKAAEPCINGFRVVTRDAQGKATSAVKCEDGQPSGGVDVNAIVGFGQTLITEIGGFFHKPAAPAASSAPASQPDNSVGMGIALLGVVGVVLVGVYFYKKR